MTTVFGGESLYDDNRFEVMKWRGVRVNGHTAVADFRGREVYHDTVQGWIKYQDFHYRVKLWRADTSSTHWYLLEENSDVDGEYQVMPQIAVGAAD